VWGLFPRLPTAIRGRDSSQISLGKQFAGRRVLVEEREAGVWLIRTAKVIPEKRVSGCTSRKPVKITAAED
jgi:hypothetical protein